MVIYIGADHRGFELKEIIKAYLRNNGYTVNDLGNDHLDENDDYPDFAAKVASEVSRDIGGSRGIVICGSGVGVDAVANKFPRLRSVLAINADQVLDSRTDDDTNVLALAADFIEEQDVKKIVSLWLQTPFSGEMRHKRRLAKIADLELRNGLETGGSQ